jgi:hypothetical protein
MLSSQSAYLFLYIIKHYIFDTIIIYYMYIVIQNHKSYGGLHAKNINDI